jgi:hydrogenase maturation protease
MTAAPLLLIAVGNPSRGDDALGPALLERLAADGLDAAGDVELMTDFQLQVEHALDLDGRRAVLFVDAALPGTVPGIALTRVVPDAVVPASSHALRPAAVLGVARRLRHPVPPAWTMAIEGACFGLGEGLSEAARGRLETASALARDWVHARRADVPRTGGGDA